LLVLALCAWLTLSSVAWAMPRHDDCCPADAAMQRAMSDHGMPNASDSCCAHAPASIPEAMVPHVLHVQADGLHAQTRPETAPQPVYKPPLRPPVA
jgi:hypothetical protein